MSNLKVGDKVKVEGAVVEMGEVTLVKVKVGKRFIETIWCNASDLELVAEQPQASKEQIRAAIWEGWPQPIAKLDVTWFAGEVERRLLALAEQPRLTEEQVRAVQWYLDSIFWCTAHEAAPKEDWQCNFCDGFRRHEKGCAYAKATEILNALLSAPQLRNDADNPEVMQAREWERERKAGR